MTAGVAPVPRPRRAGGFADSAGEPSEPGVCLDAKAAVDWLEARGIAPAEVLVWGHSLGTGVAVRLALAQQEEGAPLRGILLEAAYRSARLAGATHPVALPFRALPWGRHIVHSFMRGGDELNTEMRISTLELPICLVHGTMDSLVPFDHSKALATIVRESRRRSHHAFVPLADGGHLDSIYHPALLPAVLDFLQTSWEMTDEIAELPIEPPAAPHASGDTVRLCHAQCADPCADDSPGRGSPRSGAVTELPIELPVVAVELV